MKDRETDKDNRASKRKYYRQPKIYQNEYIRYLHRHKMVTEQIKRPDETNEEFEVLFLFFMEKHEIFLMLGR